MPSPFRWGTEQGSREVFGGAVGDIAVTRRMVTLWYRSPAQWLEVFRTNLCPMAVAFSRLDAMGRQLVADDLLDRIAVVNKATDGTLVVPAEYLEVVIARA